MDTPLPRLQGAPAVSRVKTSYEPKDIFAGRWTDFSSGRNRTSVTASPKMERDYQRLVRSNVGELIGGSSRGAPRIPWTQKTRLTAETIANLFAVLTSNCPILPGHHPWGSGFSMSRFP